MADATKTVSIIFEGETGQLDAALKQSGLSMQEFEAKLKAASDTSLPLKERVEALAGALGQTKLQASDALPTLDALAQKVKQGEEAAKADTDALKQNEEQKKTNAAATDTLAKAIKALAASFVFKEFVEANSNLEQFRNTMTLVTGDSASAQQAFEYISATSNRMGLEIQSTSTQFARLAAATKGTALEGDGAKVIFEAVAGTLASLGKSSSDTERALVQVTQGISKGKFELEDLKSIAEVIPGFFDKFATSLGITTSQLFDLISKGQIGTKEFLTFANSLNESLGSAKFDGYVQNMARLQNSITAAFTTIGDAGAWQVFNAGINAATIAVTGSVGFIKLLGETLGNILYTIDSGDWAGFGTRFDESVSKIAPSLNKANEAFLGIDSTTKTVGFNAVQVGKDIAASMTEAATAAETFNLKAFDAYLKTTTSAEGLAQKTADLVIAYAKGDVTAGDFYTRLDDIQKKQLDLDKATGGATTRLLSQEEQMKKTAKETTDATKVANDYLVKMEQIASNEKIKLIEAKVKLDIAQVEADAKVAVAAFESINTAITDTGKTLVEMLGLLDSSQDWTTFNFIRDQIEKESKRRDDAFKLQEKLIDAQIEKLQSQARALENGTALIQVDGAGLQPHLEAFMWEILQTIQVRVNQDGLELLVDAVAA